MPETMRLVVADCGRPEIVQRPIPSVDDDQVLVKVDAIALNHIDLAIMNGHTHAGAGGENAALGIEYAGTVANVGQNATQFRIGQRVMCSGPGALSEYAVTDRGHVLPFVEGQQDPEAAATLPIALQASYDALFLKGNLPAGGSVLVQGGSTAVGLACVMMAKLHGSPTVISSSRNEANHKRIVDYGADAALSMEPGFHEKVLKATNGKGVDVVVDFVSGPLFGECLKSVRMGGTIVNVGRIGGKSGEIDFDDHAYRQIRYLGASFRYRSKEECRTISRGLIRDFFERRGMPIRPLPIASRFDIGNVRDAFGLLAAKGYFGKIIVSGFS